MILSELYYLVSLGFHRIPSRFPFFSISWKFSSLPRSETHTYLGTFHFNDAFLYTSFAVACLFFFLSFLGNVQFLIKLNFLLLHYHYKLSCHLLKTRWLSILWSNQKTLFCSVPYSGKRKAWTFCYKEYNRKEYVFCHFQPSTVHNKWKRKLF